MRILLLPVTKSRTAIICQRQAVPSVRTTPRLDDRLASKGEKIWRGFEVSEKKWKQTIVKYIGKLLETVQFEENCLRTIPPLHTWKRQLAESEDMVPEKQAIRKNLMLRPIELVYPASASVSKNFNAAHSIITHQIRDARRTHRKQMIWCILGLPLTIPLAINPFIPNFPAFYLIYRIWCNWKALKAAQHLKHLSQHHQLKGTHIDSLDKIYEPFDQRGIIDRSMVEEMADLFNDNQLRRELLLAINRVEKDESKEKARPSKVSPTHIKSD